MVKKIIFVFSKYFEEKDWSIFNCPYFLEKGYEIEIWSLVQIHYKGKAREPSHLFRDYEVKYFEEIKRFKHEIKKNNRKYTIFLIYPSLGENSETGCLIRRLIRQKGFRYCDFFYPPYFANDIKDIPNSWKNITSYYLKNIKNKIIIRNLFFSWIYPPKYIFMTSQSNFMALANKYDILNLRKLKYINTPDYDKFLASNINEDLLILEKEGLEKNRYVVFLDEAYTHHSDILNMGQNAWVTEDIYGRELRNLFDFIEDQVKLKVVIALHPKAEYKNSFIFGERKMIYGKSRTLIKYSNFAITDISTAISYIMLYKKKLLMYTTNQLIRNSGSYIFSQRSLAKFMDCRIVNISKNIPDNLLTVYVKQVDEEKRMAYIKKLVCSREKNRKVTSAQIIDNCLKKI